MNSPCDRSARPFGRSRDQYENQTLQALERTVPVRARYALRRIVSRASRVWRMAIRDERAPARGLDDTFEPEFVLQSGALDARERFDVVVVEYLFSSWALSAFGPGVPKVVDTHDSLVNRHLLSGATAETVHLTMEEQLRGLRRADVVLAIQPQECLEFREVLAGSGVSCRLVSHLLEPASPLDSYRPVAATFLGSEYSMNKESLAWFMREICPAVVDRVPRFRLQLIGGICGAVPDHPLLDKLGKVEDLRVGFQRGPISVNPTLSGTGISIKMLDGMALGVPAVTTRTGARGFDAAYTNGMVVVEDGDPGAFAQALVALLDSEEKREALGRLAYADACRWRETQEGALEDLLGELARRRKGYSFVAPGERRGRT